MARIGGFDIHEGTYYRAYELNGNGWLNTNPSDEESVEGIRKYIDRRNEWARYHGESEESFCIVRTVWNSIYFPDGTFHESHETRTTVEIYPIEVFNRKKEG